MEQEVIDRLKEYFQARDDVSMAFLFGSQAKGTAMRESDTDIAVYFKPEGRHLEWEESGEYPQESKIHDDVATIAGTPSTDLVVLNRAPSPLAHDILETGIPLLMRDKGLYWRFLFLVGDATEDFYSIAQEWMAIRARSQSLSKKDELILGRLIDFIKVEISYLKDFAHVDQHTYERDRDTQLRLERWIERIVIAMIDTATIIISSEKKKHLPQSYTEIVQALGWAMNMPEPKVVLMGKFAELRNLLAHEYLDLRYAKIKMFLDNAEQIFGKVIAYANEYIAKNK